MANTRVLILTAAALCAACGGRQSSLTDPEAQAPATSSGDASALISEGDELWKARADRAQAEAAIAKWVEAAKVDGTNADLQLKLAYAYYFLANGHLRWEEEPDDLMQEAFDKGVVAAESAIKLSTPEFAKMIRDGKEWEEAIPTVKSKAGIASLYWYATNLGSWALKDGITTILRYKDRAFAIMTHIIEQDETFFYGAPHRYFGVYWVKIPFGKKPDDSKKHFERAIEISPGYLDTKILYAQNYAPRVDDGEALFDRLVDEVINADEAAISEDLRPEAKNAKRVAQWLKENKDEFF
jgi:tetratricopeptide (TPR) repeat protein